MCFKGTILDEFYGWENFDEMDDQWLLNRIISNHIRSDQILVNSDQIRQREHNLIIKSSKLVHFMCQMGSIYSYILKFDLVFSSGIQILVMLNEK